MPSTKKVLSMPESIADVNANVCQPCLSGACFAFLLMIQVDCKHWTSLSPNHLLFLSFLKQLKNNVFPFLDIVIPVFSVCLSSDSEPEVQLR